MTRTAVRGQVLVVGGGPAGSATAFFLARAGVDVVLVDRARFPRDKPCAEYLSPQASRILQEMGVLDALDRAGGAQLSGMRVRAPNGAVIHGEFASAHGFRAFRDRGLALRRTILDAILLDAARHAGVRVLEETAVRTLARDSTGRVCGVQAATADGEPLTIEAPLVVGADGLRSIVGRRANLIRVGRVPRRIALVTHYQRVQGMSPCGEMHVGAHGEGYAGLAQVGDGIVNFAVVIPASRAGEARGNAAGFVDKWIAAHPHLAARFQGAERVGPVAAVGPFNSRARVAWQPGLALVGDAADFFDPFTGEGIYAALRGGELLSLYGGEAVRATSAERADVALAAYDRARRHEFAGKWRFERMIGAAVGFPLLLNRVARTLEVRRDMADVLVGVAGDFVPAREVLRPGFLLRLILPWPGQRRPRPAPAKETTSVAPPSS